MIKTKEKALAEEIKRKYGTERGSIGIIINRINEPTMKFTTKLMACKLLRKCHKEEALCRSNSNIHTMCKGESTQLGSLSTKLVFGGLQGCVGFRYIVSLFMVDYFDSIGWLGRTKIQCILPKDREVFT
jgi:hypothetical protein